MTNSILSLFDMIYIEIAFAPLSSFKKVIDDNAPLYGNLIPMPFSSKFLVKATNSNLKKRSINEINGTFLFSPKCSPELTIQMYVGCGSGVNNYPTCLKLKCNLIGLRSTTEGCQESLIQEFCLENLSSGDIEMQRIVRVMWDDRWDFYEEGIPLSCENLENYKKRRKRDRLTRDDVIAIAIFCGVPLDAPNFFESNDDLYFWKHQYTPAEEIKWLEKYSKKLKTDRK